MEQTPKCKEHLKTLDMFCKNCKEVICYKCSNVHKEKGCKNITHPLQYMEEDVLPMYKAEMDNLKANASSIEDSIKVFLLSSKSIKEGLIKLKEELETLLNTINSSLELLDVSESVEEVSSNYIENGFMSKYEQLKVAIEKENIDYIINNLNVPFKLEIGDSERYLVEAINKSIKDVINSKELNALSKLLTDLNSKYELCTHNYKCDVKSKFIYGICDVQESGKTLCKYDILNRKLMATITVPQSCSVIQIANRIFISGGSKPYINQTSEYIEKNSALVNKSPMRDCKEGHSLQDIDRKLFTAIGGYNGAVMSCCEVYSIPDDKWEPLPSLNKARRYPATVYFNNKFLYAIGGSSSSSTIEVLNFNERETWNFIKLTSCKVSFDSNPAAIPMSKNEVLILCSNYETNAGIFNLSLNAVNKHSCSELSDGYPLNTISIIKKKAYILGCKGHMHIYDMETKELTELEYSSIFP